MSIMTGQNQEKLKPLLQTVPPGFLVDSNWLKERGITRQLSSSYVSSGWMERVLQGLYRRPFSSSPAPDTEREWKIPVLSAQWIMRYTFHVGGRTALAQHGFTHYLRLSGPGPLYVYGDVPRWLGKLRLDARYVHRQDSLIGDKTLGVNDTEFSLSSADDTSLGQRPWQWPMRLSSPERAIIEAINELPTKESFHAIDVLFEGLANLRPKLLAQLLERCRSVKTKRLFFVFADKHAHAWRKHIEMSRIDLGAGDRALVEGGKLHPVYRITVPPEFIPQGASDGP
jgi:hypothetical protein